MTCLGMAAAEQAAAGHSQPLCQLLVPARPSLCPAWRGHPSRESPHRPRHVPLLCPHGCLAPSRRHFVPRGHAGPLGAGRPQSSPAPGAVSALGVSLERAALNWMERAKHPHFSRFRGAPAVLVPRVRLLTPQRRGLHAQGRRTRQGVILGDQASGDTGTKRSHPLLHHTLWSPCDRNGCKTHGEALPRYPCFKGSFGSAAPPCWRTPPLQEAFFSNTGEIFLLISFDSNLYTLQAKHFGNHIRWCRGCGRNLFLFPFLSLSFCALMVFICCNVVKFQ